MKTQLLILTLFLTIKLSVAQQLGNGYAPPISDFSAILTSGMYTGGSPNGSVPDGGWQHLLVVRHGNSNNNYQLQIGSSIYENDKLYFRKIASGGLTTVNPVWNELATRGVNLFNGIQTINGLICLYGNGLDGGNYQKTVIYSDISNGLYFDAPLKSDGSGLPINFAWRGGSPKITFLPPGNILIGKTSQTNPAYKLDVAGKIRADEIVVNTTGADFVFEPTYQLMSLQELESYLKANRHLPGIAPANEMQENGVSAGEMQTKLLQKVEELTLYVIELEKRIKELESTKTKQ